MNVRVGFQKKIYVWILFLANFALLLSFHGLNIMIKISLFSYFKHSEEEIELILRKYEHGIP